MKSQNSVIWSTSKLLPNGNVVRIVEKFIIDIKKEPSQFYTFIYLQKYILTLAWTLWTKQVYRIRVFHTEYKLLNLLLFWLLVMRDEGVEDSHEEDRWTTFCLSFVWQYTYTCLIEVARASRFGFISS